ncbi:uncharacterized protein LOC124656219 [Lolium rigidum]|uniref:uncharacterized protein LOC124656219 n=1 Tax=Lolium rigidum TaxID=89674 RepID=UPI001F5D6FC0|nr:uncharacterized protein LOC124656219 [Lolium rigidum]
MAELLVLAAPFGVAPSSGDLAAVLVALWRSIGALWVELGSGCARGGSPPPPLPPGVYFSPTKEECLALLNRSIAAGHTAPPDARGYVFRADVYDESPDALRRRHPPASTREGDRTWWFLGHTRFRSQTSPAKRADRRVRTGGCWRVESKKKLDADGVQSCFRFYTAGTCKLADRTPWLMQEFTSAMDDGAGQRRVPALYRVYVTPHATDQQLRDTYGQDGLNKSPDGKKKPARALVPEEYFDAIAARLPHGDNVQLRQALLPGTAHGVESVQLLPGTAHGVENVQLPQALLPGSAHGENGQLPQALLPGTAHGVENVQLPQAPPPSPANLRQYRQQQEQYLREYYRRHQQQNQQAPFFGVPPPLPLPVTPDFLSELAADTQVDVANEEPADTVMEDRAG